MLTLVNTIKLFFEELYKLTYIMHPHTKTILFFLKCGLAIILLLYFTPGGQSLPAGNIVT